MIYRWSIIPSIALAVFAEQPDDPLPIWAQKHVRLDSRMTSRPGQYNPDEYPATWEFQEIFRTRHIWEQEIDNHAARSSDRRDEIHAKRIH